MRQRAVLVLMMCACVTGSWLSAQAPARLNANDQLKVHNMLKDAYESVKKNYYDPKFHGLDLDARFKEYDEKLKAVPSMNVGLTVVAAFLDGLKDSHTSFVPPSRSYALDYGYQLLVIGDDVFVERVRPGTDAESKTRPGDQVLSLNGGQVGRASFGRMQYLLQILQPQTVTRLELKSPAGEVRTVSVDTKVTQGRALRNIGGAGAGIELQDMELQQQALERQMRQRHIERDGVMIWRMPAFTMEKGEVDDLIGLARKQKTLILDLRDNPGGLVDRLLRLVSNLFDRDITVATRTGRQGAEPMVAKTRGDKAFTGQLIVLTNSGSASCAELLARVVQLEKRGTVIGDRSNGAVMESRIFPFAQGEPVMIFYAVSVTDADLMMRDGKSLEGVGVTPDELLQPTGADLAAGRDPVLSRAAKLAGLDLDPVAAAKLFPFEWK